MQLSFQGHVEKGEGLATGLGCPTANLAIEQGAIIPGLGVYVGGTQTEGKRYPSLIYISDGRTGQNLKMEVHLLGENMDLFGKHLRVYLLEKIREVIPFPGEERMAEIMKDDLVKADEWFAKRSTQAQI
jgi:riboflavin kinase/FMN adenylyltransferase